MSSIGVTLGVTYSVVGRYMAGSEVLNYHFVGTDGSQLVADKEQVVQLITRGLIDNMRAQTNGNDTLLRGKGVNLLTLPIYDQNKAQFRDSTTTQAVHSDSVTPRKNSGVSPMGQMRLTARIMYKSSNLGYMVQDLNGKQRKLSRNKVLELADQKLIVNAVVQRDGSNIKLRGFNCNLNDLPAIEVDEAGNAIQKSTVKEASVRAVKMSKSGTITDDRTGKQKVFATGDYLICAKHGEFHTISSKDLESKFKVAASDTQAQCDDSLAEVEHYTIKILGSASIVKLTAAQVLRWTVVTTTRTEDTTKAS